MEKALLAKVLVHGKTWRCRKRLVQFGDGHGCVSGSNMERMKVSPGPNAKVCPTTRGPEEVSLRPMGTPRVRPAEKETGICC